MKFNGWNCENVERIEGYQGAASAKYGSDAIGGVVNIITKTQKKPILQLNAEGMRRKVMVIHSHSNFFIRADSGPNG